jgi:hypothetical protein
VITRLIFRNDNKVTGGVVLATGYPQGCVVKYELGLPFLEILDRPYSEGVQQLKLN